MMSLPHEDRISSLPNDLLARIMNRLPFPEAARTTILSKRWHGIWKKELYNLDLSGMTLNDDCFKKISKAFLSCDNYWSVQSCVVSHPGTSWDHSLGDLLFELRWREVRSLTIKSQDRFGVFRIGFHLHCKTLTVLCLKQWVISDTQLLRGSVSLTRLCLRRCSLFRVSHLLDLLNPVSRNLKRLTISGCELFELGPESNLIVANNTLLSWIRPSDIVRTNSEPLHILELDITTTPHLKHLKIKQTHLESLTINNPELETFYLEAPHISLQTPPTIKLHSKLRSLVLRAPVKLLHNIANAYINDLPVTEDPPFMCLRRLEVELDLGGIMDSIYFCEVLRMCLVLTELVVCVKEETDQGPKAWSESFWDEQDDLHCVGHTLRRVEVRGCRGSQLEEGFVLGLVGRKAKVLQTLVLSCKSSEIEFVKKWRDTLNDYKGSSELNDIRFTFHGGKTVEQMMALRARDLEVMTLKGQKKFLEDECFMSSQSTAKQVTEEMKELVSSKDKQLHSLQFRIAELEESKILLKQKRITVGRKLDDKILKVIRLSLEVAELEESRTQLMKEVASLKAEKYLAEQALWSTQKSLNDEVKDAESARKETLRALQKLVGELCSGNGEVSDTADFPENEAIRAYVAELETIRIAFKEKEKKMKQMKEENEGLRKKGMLGWISSVVHGWFLLRMTGN